jgi:hypothetical protein
MNVIGGAAQNGNVVIGLDGVLTIENSLINNGLGYGLVMHATNQVNQNVAEVNTFQNLQKGAIFPQMIDPNAPPLTGTWLDAWSFGRGVTDIADSFYDVQAAVWFAGAANPWAMTAAGFGIRFEADGGFIWTVAEHSPIIGCESYSAEYMTGNVSATSSTISFDQEHWRSKFINSCDASQNVDTWVTPSLVELPYTIVKRFKASTNEVFWELKFTNPDGSTFSYFRK